MNYQSLKKSKTSKSKVAIIIISIIMVVALTATLVFGIYRYTQRDRARFIFEDVKLLNVESLEELEGVRFKPRDFSYYGIEEDFSETSPDIGTAYFSIINLHQDGVGNKFKEPEIGENYSFEIEANGTSYNKDKMKIVDYHEKGSVEGVVVFDDFESSEIEIYLLPYCYTQEVSPVYEVMWAPDAIGSLIKDERPEGSVVDGYCFIIVTFEPLEELKFISIEKI